MPNLSQVSQLLRRPRVVKLVMWGTAALTFLGALLLLFGKTEIAIGIVLVSQLVVVLHLLGLRTSISEISESVRAVMDERTALTLTEISRSRETILAALTNQATNPREK